MLAVDSLSELSIITPAAATSLGLPMIPCHQKFQPAGDHNELLCEKVVDVNILRMGDKTVKDVRLYVCDIEKSCAPAAGIIGLDLFSSLGIEIHGVPVNFPRPANHDEDFIEDTEVCATDPKWLDNFKAPPELRDSLLKAIQPFLETNEKIPSTSFCTHPSAVVYLNTGDASPVYVPQYRVSDCMHDVIGAQVNKWIEQGVVCEAPANSMWNSPLLAAQNRAAKANGKEPRVCIDPRKINNLLRNDPRPIPDVRSVHERLRGFKYITEIDLTKGFNQFPIAMRDRIKTTFTWAQRRLMFKGAPFGLKPLSQIFQGVIEQILSGVRGFATPFIDNIYIHTNTSFEDHIDQVCQVLKILNKWNLRINQSKCFFGYTAVNVLGHLLSGDSRRPDPSKVLAAQLWQTPQTGKEIERFLGFTNYLRDNIPNYAKLAAPLECLRKIRQISEREWTQECQGSFQKLKLAISMAPVINSPLPGVPYCLATDASQKGLGWVLYQIDPVTHKNRYIIFGAKALTKGQVNYGATRRELLAIVIALQKCRHYIMGQHFTLYTDHMALTYLFTQKHMNYMMLNWIDVLFDYDFTVVHRPGIQMILPDALSRIYQETPDEKEADTNCSNVKKVAAVTTSESVKHPDKELKEFINERFMKQHIAKEDRPELLRAHHTKGHFGAESLFSSLWHSGHFWPGMRKDCQNCVNSCLECLRFNVGKNGFHSRQFIVAELPFEHVAIDTITGFNTTDRGNNVVLVVTDICTRFKLLIPQQTKSAAETAASLWKVFCTFPLPKIIQSDNGTEFCNNVVKALLEVHGVDHRTIAAYNPRANGSAESAVGNCQRTLRKVLNGNMKDWDLYLPAVQLALNSKPNSSTKSTPASLLWYGHECLRKLRPSHLKASNSGTTDRTPEGNYKAGQTHCQQQFQKGATKTNR
jgi:transposase InsO family protein